MDIGMLLAMLVPLILYVFVDMRYGMKAGIITAIVAAFFVLAYISYRMGEVDKLLVTEVAFIVALGGISLWLKNDRYFKFQPVVLALLFAIYCAYMQFFVEPILVKYIPIAKLANPAQAHILDDPERIAGLSRMSGYMIFLFLGHAALVALAALRYSNFNWLLSRLAIYPATLIVFVMTMI